MDIISGGRWRSGSDDAILQPKNASSVHAWTVLYATKYSTYVHEGHDYLMLVSSISSISPNLIHYYQKMPSMRKINSWLVLVFLLPVAGMAAAAFQFQPTHHQILMLRCPRHPVAHPNTALHSTSENEALKAELTEYLRKRDEVNADAAAKT